MREFFFVAAIVLLIKVYMVVFFRLSVVGYSVLPGQSWRDIRHYKSCHHRRTPSTPNASPETLVHDLNRLGKHGRSIQAALREFRRRPADSATSLGHVHHSFWILQAGNMGNPSMPENRMTDAASGEIVYECRHRGLLFSPHRSRTNLPVRPPCLPSSSKAVQPSLEEIPTLVLESRPALRTLGVWMLTSP